MKLQKKDDLLRRGEKRFKSKHWVLLKRGYSTDDLIGFEVNRIVGMPYQPAYEYVNLFLNGEYRGLYMIAENIRRDPSCRINVDAETGFITELDVFYQLENLYFTTEQSPYGFTYPFDPEWYKKRGTFTEQLQGLRQWFAERKEWMEQHIDEIRVEETGIHDAVSCSASPQVYDLSGRKSDYRKGLRLIKGRKMMVK